MLRKKGQDTGGGGAAALVAIITLLIILYIIFIPPGEREKILGINDSEDDDNVYINGTKIEPRTLLEEQPGKIFYLPQKEIEHDLPSINLFTKTEGMIIKEVDSLAVRKALFNEKKHNITFNLDYFEHTKNVLLSFNKLKSTSGELIIKLNGVEIFNKDLRGITDPVKLPDEYLMTENILEFEASGIGMVFWKVNEFIIGNVKVTADITETAASESKSMFIVSRTEKNNIEGAKLRFYAGCQRQNVGRLFAEINGYNIFSGIPDCGQPRNYEFSPEKLIEGENTVRFRTEKGHYTLDQIVVKTELVEPEQYVWFFHLNEKEYESLEDNKTKINLTVEFVDNDYKEGYFIINGHETGFSTRELYEEWSINPYVRKGGNSIKLDPKNNMFITELKIDFE